MEHLRSWLDRHGLASHWPVAAGSAEWSSLKNALLKHLHPSKAVNAAQAAADNTLAVFMSPPPEPTSTSAPSLPIPPPQASQVSGRFPILSRFPATRYNFPPLPAPIAQAIEKLSPLSDSLGRLYEEYSKSKYRKYHLALLFLLYTLGAVVLGKWMEGNWHEDPEEVSKPIQGEPGWVDPKFTEKDETAADGEAVNGTEISPLANEEGAKTAAEVQARVDIFHDRGHSPLAGSSAPPTNQAAEVHRVASSLVPPTSPLAARYHAYDSGTSSISLDVLAQALKDRGVEAVAANPSSPSSSK